MHYGRRDNVDLGVHYGAEVITLVIYLSAAVTVRLMAECDPQDREVPMNLWALCWPLLGLYVAIALIKRGRPNAKRR